MRPVGLTKEEVAVIASQYPAWLSPAQALNRYESWVAAGLDELERWLAAQNEATDRPPN